MKALKHEATARSLAAQGAMFYVSHSGGKDSQAMYSALSRVVPLDQIVVVHADLGAVEWDGVKEHIRSTIDRELNVVRAIDRFGNTKELLPMVYQRWLARPDAAAWPSSAIRYCTSDLKRGPIEKFIRGDLKARGKHLAVNCMGLRAEESHARAKREALTVNARLSKAGREVYDWLPVHEWTAGQVFEEIASAGQRPHRAYELGNDRLSCVFCIFGSQGDLENGARQRPELARAYIDLEERTGRSMFNGASLGERIGHLIPTTTITDEEK